MSSLTMAPPIDELARNAAFVVALVRMIGPVVYKFSDDEVLNLADTAIHAEHGHVEESVRSHAIRIVQRHVRAEVGGYF